MLRFICGVEGTGKSVLLRKKLTEAASRGKNTIYIVPDQFSFEAEKLIYRTVPHEFSRRCRVTMFSREAQRLLKTYGETKPYADDIAKRIIIKLALEEVCSEGGLEYYRGQAEKEGFPAFALNVISDMRGAGISPSELRSRLAAENTLTDVLARKLNDISLIYSAYDRILALNFDDKLDDVRRASELATDTDEYSGSMIFIDEFDSFSGSQLGFIHALLDKAEEVTVALTCDWPDCKDRRYEAVNRLIGKIAGDREKQITVLKERFREPSELRVIKARDSWQECDWICAEIRSLMDSGVRCREIAVISPDIGSTRILGSAMMRYDIPLFADIPETLISRSFVSFCIYTLKAL
ncbi:MAG: hypothetical protein J6X60_04615, partial [Ruminiclostridium sp.]|nr:hypothetical protein [Ruminiclostridium sp.]